MTKLNLPLLSFTARGTLSHLFAFTKRRRHNIIERMPTPTDAKSPAQLFYRNMFQQCTALWHTLGQAEKAQWEKAATPQHMTGYALWQSSCLRPNPGLYLPLLGGTMQGNIDMASKRLLNLVDPVADQEPTTKKFYYDHLSAGYTDAQALAAAVQAGAITDSVTKAPTHDAVYDVKLTADAAQTAAQVDTKVATHAALTATHGVAGTIAGLADIATHAALTATHGVAGIIASVANIATHAALTATHGVAGTIAGVADIATHAALTATHGVAGTIASVANIATHAALTTGVHGHIAVGKTADETVNNSSSLQNDDQLQFAVAANEVWAFIIMLKIATTAVADFKYALAVPTNGAVNHHTIPSLVAEVMPGWRVAATGYSVTTSGNVTNSATVIVGIYKGGNTAGFLNFQWAQNTAEATNTKVLTNSCLIAFRMA